MYLKFASDDMRFMIVAVGFIILSMGSVLDVQSLSDDEFEDFTTNNGQQDYPNDDSGPFFYDSINK